VMLGSALIKLRGDPCWTNLTCLDFHFETQPNPNPLAWWLHHAPHAVHAAGVLFTLSVELVAPVFAFGFRRARHLAGALMVALQLSLIASGNLSFLNWLTIVPALACFDDTVFVRFARVLRVGGRRRGPASLARFQELRTPRGQAWAARVLGVIVSLLSVGPAINLVSSSQAMNRSFDPLDLVNTYGAFGSVDRERYEIILEGAPDVPDAAGAPWREYELPCMPGDVRRRPCLVSPYHYRLDWQMWFVGNGAARGEPLGDEPWLVHLVWQILNGDPAPRPLFARDPFPGAPPRWVRARLWRYRFSATRADGAWWTRDPVAEALPPTSLDDPGLRAYVQAYGWAPPP
jgi:lipase maturation factor